MLVIAVILTGIALWKLHAQNVAQDREIDNLREHVQSLLNQNPTRIVSRR